MSAHPLPRPAAWILTGLAIDVALWGVLTAAGPVNPVATFFAVSTALCWVHLVVAPTLAGRGRATVWRDAGVVLAGAVATGFAIAAGAVVGLAVGVGTFFVGGVPGFLAGGAVTGSLTAAAMKRLLRDPARAVPTGQAVAAAIATVVVLLGILFLSAGAAGNLVAAAWLGTAASVATVPAGAAAWVKRRWLIWWITLATAAVPLGVIAWLDGTFS